MGFFFSFLNTRLQFFWVHTRSGIARLRIILCLTCWVAEKLLSTVATPFYLYLWRKAWQPTPIFLPGPSHGQRSLGATVHGLAKSQDTTEWLTLSLSSGKQRWQLRVRRKWMQRGRGKQIPVAAPRLTAVVRPSVYSSRLPLLGFLSEPWRSCCFPCTYREADMRTQGVDCSRHRDKQLRSSFEKVPPASRSTVIRSF